MNKKKNQGKNQLEFNELTKPCPSCGSEVPVQRWGKCPNCGVWVHIKIKPNGRIGKIAAHRELPI